MILVWTFLSFVLADSAMISSFLAPNQPLRDGETLVSAGGIFEFGFFSPPSSSNRYLGIWYANVSPITTIWIANREVPLINHFGVLNLTKQGTLTILDEKGKTLWSSEQPKATKNPVLQLLDSGNAVVQEESDSSSGNYSWQSFDYPSDTLLREMKLGRNFVTGLDWLISSWKSSDDPARGEFSAWVDPKGYPQLVVRRGNATYYRGGSWNGVSFTGTPGLRQISEFLKYEFEFNKNEVYYKWEPSSLLISRWVMNQSGFLEWIFWIPQSKVWSSVSHVPSDQCDFYAVCGAYASCNTNSSKALCGCLEGFGPKYPKEWKDSKWSNGCSRKVELSCANDVFRQYMGLKLPDTSTAWFNTSMSLVECKEKCARNCSCTAYAKSNIGDGGSGCLLWFTDLIDMKVFGEGGQVLFIRMGYSKGLSSSPGFSKKVLAAIICSMSVIMVLVGSIIYYRKKLRDKGGEDEIELQVFSLTQLARATDNFSNNSMLGKGGFGPVYKGILPDKQEIAVKRLSRTSGQGMVELKNEVKLIAKLQHRNLVKLLGCCIHGDEKLLVYEYMPNKSLDHFIFDQTRSTLLDWPKRMQIVIGIARGLLYLHQDSRLRIIHRDLKASNILLDNDMNPKISDFGMARSFWADQTEANTNKVVGTYGYMSPEYAVDGLFSLKSDVFSFGVLVLELISGKKNRGFKHPEHDHNLLGHAWTLWMEDRVIGLIDNELRETCLVSEVLRCIHVALLCVQQRPEDRPSMSSVVVMLGSETPLPKPRKPGFFQARNLPEADYSSSKHESVSKNEMSISAFEPR